MDPPPERAAREGALMAKLVDARMPRPAAGGLDQGPFVTLKDYADLARAPKRQTRVTVKSYDVPAGWVEKPPSQILPPWFRSRSPDHMFVEYDDGREQYIARGGPKGAFKSARVDAARRSPDFRRGERVLYSEVLPGQSAREAIGPALELARRTNGSGQPYLVFGSNSNSYVGDLTQEQLGRRIGDRQTWGYRSGEPEGAPPY